MTVLCEQRELDVNLDLNVEEWDRCSLFVCPFSSSSLIFLRACSTAGIVAANFATAAAKSDAVKAAVAAASTALNAESSDTNKPPRIPPLLRR